MTTDASLREILDTLIAEGEIPVGAWPAAYGEPESLGLRSGDGRIFLGADVELLTSAEIARNLSQKARLWVRRLELHSTIGSTNDRLMELADAGTVDGTVCLAELQTKGRGRRGRAWLSPFAGQVALSIGVALRRGMQDLGGLSLVVGLATVDCLGALGVRDLALKWPNDVLLGGRKLGGILIELKNRPGASASGVEVVIGIGLNVDVPALVRDAIDQAVTDLTAAGPAPSRNVLAGGLVSSVLDYVKEFEEIGFAPMRELFNQHHLFHGRRCEITQGEAVVVGQVVGVTEVGEILLETGSGTRAFGAGEVSMRRRD